MNLSYDDVCRHIGRLFLESQQAISDLRGNLAEAAARLEKLEREKMVSPSLSSKEGSAGPTA